MELIERLPLREIEYLNNLNFETFKQYSGNCKNEDERKIKFGILQNYCKTNIKTRGETKRIYSYTQTTPLEVGGRLYSGNSIQSIPKDIRGLLLRDISTDIDMKNAHPVILKYICKINNIPCPNLSWYVENREEVLMEFGADGKTAFLKAVNDDKINRKIPNQFFKDFDKECKVIQKAITKLPCYSDIVKTVPSVRTYNWLGSAINRVLCVFENKILQEVISICNKNQIEVLSLMFDGLMMYGDQYKNSELLKEITDKVESIFPELGMVWCYKEHSNTLHIPEDYSIPEVVVVNPDKNFKSISDKFELTHCKIVNKSFFVCENPDNIILMSKPQIITAYENIIYEKPSDTKDGVKLVETNFINDWLRNNPTQRSYADMGCFPDKSKCPSNYFNTWQPFAMEKITEYTEKPDALRAIKAHILILCGNSQEVATYFEAWIAQMIQYPAVKSICPTFISKEGAGKGTLMRLMEKMLGNSKVFETASPSRDIWGDFNGRMASTFLVNLNELSKRETSESEGRIKGLITDPKLTINNKGVNQYDIDSYHRFIISTNNEEPIKTARDDRRNLVIRSSDELCGNKEYFTTLYKMLEDENVIKTCYEYFKNIEGMDCFNKLPLPLTEYHSELQTMSVSPLESWIKSLVEDNFYKPSIELTDKVQYDMFKVWCKDCGLEYNITSMQFGVRLKRLNITGIDFGKHTNKGNTKVFDIETLKKYFKIENAVLADEHNPDVVEEI